MTDRQDGDTSLLPGGANAASRDGLIDFTHYSEVQLRELEFTIDRTAYPLNFSNLLQELARRSALREKSAQTPTEFSVRFTRHDGLPGWLQAKAKLWPLYGAGTVQLKGEEIAFQGWQRTWLGMPTQAEIAFSLENLRSVARVASCIHLQFREPRRLSRRLELEMESIDQAQALVAHLPQMPVSALARQWAQLREFNQKALALNPHTWVTTGIVVANVLVFAAMCIAAGQLIGKFDLQRLLQWGANFGPLTVNGQWWRLFSALFLHANLAHLVLNLWALWNAGRLVERLYGRWNYLFIYFVCGAFASLGSIAWNPANGSVGASGAIFGVLGAFLAFLANRSTGVPPAMVRAHWLSTLAFVVYNLISGMLQPGIDNAAHVSGLLSGFIFGWILARSPDIEVYRRFPTRKAALTAVVTLVGVIAALWQVRGLGSQLTESEKYIRAHEWYVTGEGPNLRLWQELANGAGSGTVSDAVLAIRFEKEILPFWKDADQRLRKELSSVAPDQKSYATLVADFARSRLNWAQALIDATKNEDTTRGQDALRLMRETSLIQARLERAAMRSAMDHRPRALAASAPVRRIRALFSGTGNWNCVEARDFYGPGVASTDSRTDWPAAREAAACEAQRLFMAGDYAALDSVLARTVKATTNRSETRSSLDALYRWLSTLADEGHLPIEEAMARTADWRRELPNSVEPELVEAQFLQDWAWAARGTGYRKTVSPQAWFAFAYRTEMAAQALREIAPRALSHPQWYVIRLNTGLDESLKKGELRKRFDAGVARFPEYWPLHSSMLRILMPRWGGSREEVDAFIREMSWKAGKPARMATYAQLYWTYSILERDDTDIFGGGLADWPEMKSGFGDLMRRYPKSDYVLNAFASFACRSGDAAEYRQLRPQVGTRFSTIAWSNKWPLKVCDDKVSGNETKVPQTAGDTRASLLKYAQAAFAREDWAAARAAGQELIDADPTSLGGYLTAASAEEAASHYDAASTLYRKALSLDPKQVEIWQQLGGSETHAHHYPEALEALNQANQLAPENWDVWSDRAIVHDALGQRSTAMKDARIACRNGHSFACQLVKEWEP